MARQTAPYGCFSAVHDAPPLSYLTSLWHLTVLPSFPGSQNAMPFLRLLRISGCPFFIPVTGVPSACDCCCSLKLCPKLLFSSCQYTLGRSHQGPHSKQHAARHLYLGVPPLQRLHLLNTRSWLVTYHPPRWLSQNLTITLTPPFLTLTCSHETLPSNTS